MQFLEKLGVKAEMVNKRSMERFGMTNLSICGKWRRICITSELRDELKSLKLEWFELVKKKSRN